MLTIKEDSALIGVAELRTKAAEVLKEVKKHNVILTRRNKPVGVIMDYDEYEKMQAMLDEVEDIVLGKIAMERLERKDKRVITLEDAERRVGLR
ncbi:MAG: type II toxin-antitoxin system Phd/YefM family antitoxin [Nitrospirae bacterium]|nr:type II toxin-antitoxin system Phd/YefM family antitoxin [Nitrospirota bacterium]